MNDKAKTTLLVTLAVLALGAAAWQATRFVQGPKEEIVGDLGDLSGERGGGRPETGQEDKRDASGAPPDAPTQ